MAWPTLQSQAPGELIKTSGTEWLPTRSALPTGFSGPAYLPHGVPPAREHENIIAGCWEDAERAVRALVGLDGLSRNLPNPNLFSRPFRIREAQASSRIENTIATAEEVALADTTQTLRDESREVANYDNALEAALHSERALTQGFLKDIHQELLGGSVRGAEKYPGRYRHAQAYIAGAEPGFDNARFVPPPAEHLQACMDNLEEFMVDDRPVFPVVIWAAITHYQFETIHPFSDGNGRLGRMLILLQLSRSGVLKRPLIEVSSFFDEYREMYFDLLLKVSLEGAWIEWIRFFCRGIARQAVHAETRANRLLDLRRDYIDRVTEPRASALLRELADWLFTRPAVRTADVAARLSIRPQAAQRHVDRLVDKGILTEVTGRSYDRIYVARGVLAVIEEPIMPPEPDAPLFHHTQD